MHMVLDAAYDDGLAVEVGKNAAEVALEFVAERGVAQERAAVFGGKDGMNEDLGQGLRHRSKDDRGGEGMQPFQGWDTSHKATQGSSFLATLG